MLDIAGNRPAEIFGYSISDLSDEAQDYRKRRWCRFLDDDCKKNSSLIDYPFGVCSVRHGDGVRAVCPYRFEEQEPLSGVPKVFKRIAEEYFGDLNNLVTFREVRLPNVGNIDYVLVRHKPLKPEVEISSQWNSNLTLQPVRGIWSVE